MKNEGLQAIVLMYYTNCYNNQTKVEGEGMDFSRNSTQQAPAARAASTGTSAGGGGHHSKKNGAWSGSPLWLRIVWIVLLFSATILAVAMVVLLYIGGPREEKLVDKEKFQAVFLSNGQVYFGNIASINDEYVDLKNIYYLNVDQPVQPEQQQEGQQQQSNITLVKLGCELHGPVDQMVVNRDQLTFWENLKTDGQVSKAIDQWVKQNPDGQECNTDAQSTREFLNKNG